MFDLKNGLKIVYNIWILTELYCANCCLDRHLLYCACFWQLQMFDIWLRAQREKKKIEHFWLFTSKSLLLWTFLYIFEHFWLFWLILVFRSIFWTLREPEIRPLLRTSGLGDRRGTRQTRTNSATWQNSLQTDFFAGSPGNRGRFPSVTTHPYISIK